MQNALRSVCILRLAVCIAASLTLSACGARRIALPVDPGAPLPDFADVYRTLTASCGGVRTFTAELGLSGRAGGRRVRGRAIVGFARPDSLRLEGVAPLGPPAFILAARGANATLLLPRDDRVVRNAPPDQILEALTGVALSPADLQAVLTGCAVPIATPVAGRLHQNGWASIDLDSGAMVYLEREGAQWRLRAGRHREWHIEYPSWQGAFPSAVRLISLRPAVDVDLTAAVSQLETNVQIDEAAFTVNVPPGASELSLAELREAGPLRN
jgi:outer membrane biogenesis lipoprotein LolB